MGGGISLDAIALGVGKRLDLAFTVRFIAIDDAEAQMFSAKVGPMLLESFKMDDSEEFRKFKDANLDLVCCFYDKNGDSLTTVTLLSKEYK